MLQRSSSFAYIITSTLTATACAAGSARTIDVLNLPSANDLAAIVDTSFVEAAARSLGD